MDGDDFAKFVGQDNLDACARFLSQSGDVQEVFDEAAVDEFQRVLFLAAVFEAGAVRPLLFLDWCATNYPALLADYGVGARGMLMAARAWDGWAPEQAEKFTTLLRDVDALRQRYSQSPLRSCVLWLLAAAGVADDAAFKAVCKQNRLKPRNIVRTFREDGVIEATVLRLLEIRI